MTDSTGAATHAETGPGKPNAAALRIVLLGSRGLLGNSLLPALRQSGNDVRCVDRAELNLADLKQIDRVLGDTKFDVLINATGYTAVDDCELNERLAFLVNGDAPARLADLASKHGARFIHFSTDYVFDGQAFMPYREDDPAEPISIYGKSKRAGELGVLQANGKGHLVIRLSWLFGPGRIAFPRWVLRKAIADGSVKIVEDKSASPSFAVDVAQWMITLLQTPTKTHQIVHLCNSGVCSWKEYGEAVIDCAVAAGLLDSSVPVHPVKLADLPGLIAPRPLFSALDTSRFTQLTGVHPRPWEEAVAEHVRGLAARAKI